ncbi:MAG: 3'-5' exonuclease [Epsilonproteobacteria bacterium]|nr:3'-5' exonuclease [Campylobacterota bacterium]
MDKFINALKKGISKEDFLRFTQNEYPGFEFEAIYDLLKFQGLPLEIVDEKVYLKTALIPYEEAEYTVLDLEVNNSKPLEGQIIEIGAVKISNLKAVDEFSFLIYAKDVPRYVTRVTGIDEDMLKNEKSQKEILQKFRLFLKDSVIVAHAADFDFNFLASQFKKEGLGELLNRHLCTISLAKKTLKASRYGLKYLKEELNLSDEVDHRALADAKTTKELFLKALNHLPDDIISAEDLIEFAKPGKKN